MRSWVVLDLFVDIHSLHDKKDRASPVALFGVLIRFFE